MTESTHWETPCPKRDDGQHCNCWYDGDPCCACGDNTKPEDEMTPEQIARVAHEVNRAYCQALGDTTQPAWEEAPEWQRNSAISGVAFHLVNPDAGPDHSHNEWLREKEATGWKYGPVKDPEKKEHPCFVPYEQLPVEQKAKDYLFRGVVHALAR